MGLPEVRKALKRYLSKSSIGVTGKFRLKTALILTTLRIGSTRVGSDSAQLLLSVQWKD
jgi:hypothetical protein